MKKKKKVLIDARMVTSHGHGIGNYVQELALGFSQKKIEYELEFLIQENLPQNHIFRSFSCHESKIPFLHPKEVFSLAWEIKKIGPDLYHSTSFSSLLHYPCPHIQTVHDLNHLHFGSKLNKIYYRTILLPSIRKSRKLITVSETIKQELENWLGQFKVKKDIMIAKNVIQKISVAPDHSILDAFPISLRKGFYFCLSNPKTHKNLNLIETAYKKASEKKSLLPLVLSIEGKSKDNIIKTGPLTLAQIHSLFLNAKSFYFPSLYEGFSRPPLEAAVHGLTPIVSDIPVHREVLKGLKEAILIHPLNTSAWANQFLQDSTMPVSQESRNWIENEYHLNKLVSTMNEIYQEALFR